MAAEKIRKRKHHNLGICSQRKKISQRKFLNSERSLSKHLELDRVSSGAERWTESWSSVSGGLTLRSAKTTTLGA